jgi:hypothetical protein
MPTEDENADKSSGNRIDDKEYQKALKNRKEEAALFSRFKKVATSKLERMTNEAQDGGPPYTMGKQEQEILRQLQGMGFKEGIAATALAFVILRRGPIHVARWLEKRQLARQQSSAPNQSGLTPPPASGGYQLADPNKVPNNNPFAAKSRNPNFPRSKSFIIRSIWFTFDSVLSLMLGTSISMAYTDTEKIREQVIGMPLVPGRSLTSDALCDDIVKELQQVKKARDPAYVRLSKQSGQEITPAAFYLQGLVGFSENCQRRRFAEQQFRQERGLESSDPVEIPEPGVSKVGPRMITNGDGEEAAFGSESEEFDDLTRWATDLVEDNDESSRRSS